jgi:hypothetical protein
MWLMTKPDKNDLTKKGSAPRTWDVDLPTDSWFLMFVQAATKVLLWEFGSVCLSARSQHSAMRQSHGWVCLFAPGRIAYAARNSSSSLLQWKTGASHQSGDRSPTLSVGSSGNVSELYPGNVCFKTRSAHLLSSLWFFVVFLSPSKNIPGLVHPTITWLLLSKNRFNMLTIIHHYSRGKRSSVAG